MQMPETEESMGAKAWTGVEVGSGQKWGAPGLKGRREAERRAGQMLGHSAHTFSRRMEGRSSEGFREGMISS